MRQPVKSRWCVALAFASLLLAMSMPAARAADEIAKMVAAEGRIVWEPKVEYWQLRLTVSKGERVYQQTFGASAKPYFSLVDERGQPLPDGSYTYELSLVPRIDPDRRAAQVKARETGDPKMLERLAEELRPKTATTQSGTFSLSKGAVADPAAVEPDSEEPAKRSGDLLIAGSLDVEGAKRFVMEDPVEPGQILRFVALEGPEVGTYYRATARLVDGEAVVELPEHFRRATEPEGLTVQLTPIGGWSQLYVTSKSIERLVVRSAAGALDVEFDILVNGVRKGYAAYQPAVRGSADRDR